MGSQDGIHVFVGNLDLRVMGDLCEVCRRRLATDHSVGFIGYRGLVYDRVEHTRSNSRVLTPLAREDVMYVNLPFIAIQVDHSSIPKEIYRAMPLKQYIQSAIRGTCPRPKRIESIWLKSCRLHSRRFGGGGSLNPSDQLLQIQRDARFYRAAIQLSKDTTPIPTAQLRFNLRLKPSFFQRRQECGEGH